MWWSIVLAELLKLNHDIFPSDPLPWDFPAHFFRVATFRFRGKWFFEEICQCQDKHWELLLCSDENPALWKLRRIRDPPGNGRWQRPLMILNRGQQLHAERAQFSQVQKSPLPHQQFPNSQYSANLTRIPNLQLQQMQSLNCMSRILMNWLVEVSASFCNFACNTHSEWIVWISDRHFIGKNHWSWKSVV